jgi:hypothetical protein
VDITTLDQLRGEVFKNVSRIARAGQKDSRPTSASPVEDFNFNPIADFDELRTGRCVSRSRAYDQQRQQRRWNPTVALRPARELG